MAGYGEKPFGLRQLRITSADGSGVVTLPFGLMLHVTPRIEVAEFMAEGVMVGASARVVGAEWELEAGGISLEALAKLTGLSAAAAGSAPNRTLTLNAGAGAAFPYVRIYGRAVGDGSDDIYCRLYRAKLTSMEGTFRRGDFWITSCAGVAVADSNGVFEFVQRETGAAI